MGLNLHTHLEGWVRPVTERELARDAGVPDPAGGWIRALRMDGPADLTTYLAHVAAAYPVLGSEAAIKAAASGLGAHDSACHFAEEKDIVGAS